MSFKEEIRHDYPLNEDSIVFDIGGYKGEWSQIIYDRYKCKIYCFEPVFDIQSNDFTVYPIGIGGRSRAAIIHVDTDKTGVFCSTGEAKTVVISDIMEVIATHNIENIDLMKINIEGMEYELLFRLLDADWVKNIHDIQVQFHRIAESDRLMWEIQDGLKETHYPTYQYRYVWENWRRKNNDCPMCGGNILVNSMGYYCNSNCGFETIV